MPKSFRCRFTVLFQYCTCYFAISFLFFISLSIISFSRLPNVHIITYSSQASFSNGYDRHRVFSIHPVQTIWWCGGLHPVLGSGLTQNIQYHDSEGQGQMLSYILTLTGNLDVSGFQFDCDTTNIEVGLIPSRPEIIIHASLNFHLTVIIFKVISKQPWVQSQDLS